MRFDGQVVLVTGATSGIGAETARAFARAGAALMLSGRDRGRGERVLAELGDARAELLAGDLRDRAFAERLVEAAHERLGGLDVVVNNAGILHHGAVDETSDAVWLETLAINVNAVFYVSRAAVKRMRGRGGVIVNVASDWALVAGPRAAAYCASKGAVLQLTRAMAIDHARDGIRVNAVCPGEVETPMLETEAAELGLDYDEARRAWAAQVPLGRIASASDVAGAILFLASSLAAHVTGVALPVDGGGLAR